MRADAKKNYDHLLTVAHGVISEHGAEASLRDIARRAEVGLATLYRHFPTREALLETLLRENLDRLTKRASELEASDTPHEALIAWFRDGLAFTQTYSGVVELMAAALEDEESALHASCWQVRAAGGRLLERAQAEGLAPRNIDATDLCAFMGAIAWLGEQPAFASRADNLCEVIIDRILASPAEARTCAGYVEAHPRHGATQLPGPACADDLMPVEEGDRIGVSTVLPRIAQLEEENRKLRQIVADLSLEKHTLQHGATRTLLSRAR